MKKWRIKRRRDWGVAAFFLLLLSYLAALRYQQPINEWLMGCSPEKLSSFNQPEYQGVYGLAVLLAAVLFSLLWIWQRRAEGEQRLRVLMILWAGTAVLLAGIFLSYRLECSRIVNTPYDTDLVPRISVSCRDGEESREVELTEEDQEALLALCLALEPLSGEEQEELWEQGDQEPDVQIQIWYPEHRRHSYHLWFSLTDRQLRFHKGHSLETDIFYDGSEVRRLLFTAGDR